MVISTALWFNRKPWKERQMTSIYEDKDTSALELAEELSQVNCQDELDFDYLFEYDPPCSNFATEDQGLYSK